MAKNTIPVPKYGQTVVDSMGRSGVAKFDPNTGKALNAPQTSTVAKTTTTMAPQSFAQARETSKQGTPVQMQRGYFDNGTYNMGKSPKVSTVTISNLNKKNQIPQMVNNLQEYDKRGMVSDGETIKYPDGQIFEQEQTVTNSDIENDYKNSPEYQLLQQMRQSLDSSTAGQIAGIQQQVDERRREVNEYSAQQSKAYERSMLMGGATGKGSQSQFAPGSVQGVMSAQEKYRVKQISDLDRQEVQLIQAAKEAQREGDFRLLGQQMELIKGLRKQKQDEVAKMNVEIAKRNEKLRDQIYVAQRDNAVADLYQQGVTSPAEIFQALQDAGGDFTIKEINETLETLIPPGLDDLVKTARENGAPAEVIQNLLQSNDLGQAYEKAGGWTAGGSGILREYNVYRAQSIGAGQVPVDFQTYQNIDANRKKSIAKAGVASSGGGSGSGISTSGGKYTSDIDALAGTVRSSLKTGPAREGFDDAMSKARNDNDKLSIIASTANIPGSVRTDIANTAVGQKNIKSAIKLVEDGVKTGLLISGQQYAANVVGKSVDPKLTQLQSYLTAAIQPYRSSVTGAAWGAQEEAEYSRMFGSAKDTPENLLNKLKTLDKIMSDKRIGLVSGSVSPLADTGVFETTSVNNQIIDQGKQAENKVIQYGSTNPKAQSQIRKMVADGVPYLTIQQVLNIQ